MYRTSLSSQYTKVLLPKPTYTRQDADLYHAARRAMHHSRSSVVLCTKLPCSARSANARVQQRKASPYTLKI